MAINLWEQQGKPTSYNPLPTSYGNAADFTPHTDYIISFKAKSDLGARIVVQSYGKSYATFKLNSEYQSFAVTAQVSSFTMAKLYLYDTDQIGNIIVKDIKVVEKKTAFTINLIDGFEAMTTGANGYSPKWTFPNGVAYKVIDNETFELYATANGQGLNVEFDVTPYTEYYAYSETGKYAIANTSGVTTGLLGYGDGYRKFNSGANTKLKFFFSNLTFGFGTFLFKRPMVTLKGIVPYEPKIGEKAVEASPTKNMLKPSDVSAMVNSKFTYSDYRIDIKTDVVAISSVFMDVEPYTEYTFSADFEGTSPLIAVYDEGATTSIANYNQAPRTFNSGMRTRVRLYFKSDADGVIKNYQFEKGTKTPFQPYKARRNKPAYKETFKNLSKENTVTLFAPTNENVIHDEVIQLTVGQKYTLSAYIPKNVVIQPRKAYTGLVYTNMNGNDDIQSITFTATHDILVLRKYSNATIGTFIVEQIMLEKGGVKTDYKPYELKNKKIVRGLPRKNFFNGDYEDGYLVSTTYNEKPLVGSNGQRTSKWIQCKPSIMYSLSGGDRSSWHFKNGAGVISGAVGTQIVTPSDAVLMRVYYSSDGSHEKIQIEEGIETAYEPYSPRPILAYKGLKFDGSRDRLAISSNTDKLSELDFTIESVFNWDGANVRNESQQTIFSCGDIRFGFSSSNLKLGYHTLASGWVDATPVAPTVGRDISLKVEVKPDRIKLWIDGVLVGEKTYSGSIMTQTLSHIGTLGGGSYWFNGTLKSFKIDSKGINILDYDFTNPMSNSGLYVYDKKGIATTIFGSPIQLNKQSKR